MADNVTLNAMTGGDTIAADDIGGIKWQRMKAAWGADGVATDVSAATPLPVTLAPAGTVGTDTLTAALTAAALNNHPCLGATIRAGSTNTGTVYIGGTGVTTATGFPLTAGEALSLDVTNTNTVYVVGANTTDTVRYIWVTA